MMLKKFGFLVVLLSLTLSSWGEPELNAQKIDPNMMLKPVAENGLKWFIPAEKPLRLQGFYWYDQDQIYRRLPAKYPAEIPNGVNHLAWHTAGGQVQFRTDSSRIVLKVKMRSGGVMYHMPSTGSHGFDLYTKRDQSWRYTGTASFDPAKAEYTTNLMNTAPAVMRSAIINFPLYAGVESVFIGVDENAKVEPPLPYENDRPIVVYGTSIQQGGCASRPGMASTNILSRKLNRPIINLAFSGSGRGEPVMAELISTIKDPALLVLDYEANGGATYHDTLPVFIKMLREKHPETPILVISKIRYANEHFDREDNSRPEAMRQSVEKQKALVEELRKNGDQNIHFVDGGDSLGADYEECTVDGVHPNDLGFSRIADHLEPHFKRLAQ